MATLELPIQARPAMRARYRKEIDELDYRRELLRLESAGYSQRQISNWLRITQPSVHSALKTAAKDVMPLEGFSGATPSEICKRYAGGFIDRAQLVDELTRFPYAKGGQTDGFDSLIVDSPGTWSEVDDAARRGLVGDDVYEEVFNRRHGIIESATESEGTSAEHATIALAQELASVIDKGEVSETQLVESIASATGQSQAAVAGVLDSLFAVVSAVIAGGTNQALAIDLPPTALAFAEVIKRIGTGHNPQTGEEISIPAIEYVKIAPKVAVRAPHQRAD